MKVFLSHSTRDKDFVLKLADRLQPEGFDPWLCEISIHPSDNWIREINDGLLTSDLFLLVWSPDAAVSSATELEWTSAVAREISERRVRLGLILLREHPLPELLRTKQYIDARRDAETGIAATVKWLKERRDAGRSSGSQAPVYLPDFRPENLVVRRDLMNKMREALVDQPGVFLLAGQPGIGKSTLAWMFGREAQKDFDAVVCQVCGDRPVEVMVAELADRLRNQIGEIAALSPERKLREIKNWLCGRQTLLILDDVWPQSNLGAGADPATLKLADLVPGASVSVLFTSRHPSLPWVGNKRRETLEAFTPDEAEAVFRNYLGDQTVNTHRQALLDFADRMGRLPVALTVGADLLRSQFGPLSDAARGLALRDLQNDVHSVPGLFQRAIDSQGEPERRLLAAGAVCASEGFWLPLAIAIAGLSQAEGCKARDYLVNASLLRVVDQERQRFQLHALLREHVLDSVFFLESLELLRRAHAQALEVIFKMWQTRWRECRECLEEIAPAVEFLRRAGQSWRGDWLSFCGYACAQRIGQRHAALLIVRQDEAFWSNREDSPAKDGLQRSYGHQANILRGWGRLEEAFALLKKQEAICLEQGNKNGLQASYGTQALILKTWGRPEEALALLKEQEAICQKPENKDGLQWSYGSQASILKAWGRLEEALALLKQQEAICLELGNKADLGWSYESQASILEGWGRLEEALALLKKQEAICEELGDKAGLQGSYGGQAWILKARGRLEEALALLKKREAMCGELGDKDSLQGSYGDQALILMGWGRLEEALDLLKKQEAICEKLGNKDSLQVCYGNQALILMGWGKLEESLELLKKQEAICEKLGNKDSLQRSHGNQALILMGWGRFEDALALLKKQETSCEELRNKVGLQLSYGNQARILIASGRQEQALALLKKQEEICEELGNKDGLQMSYGNQALILMGWGKLEESLELLKKQEDICEQLGSKLGLQTNYGNQAGVLIARWQLNEALVRLERQEAICKELGSKAGLGQCYRIWSLLAVAQGDEQTAKEKLTTALALFSELGMTQVCDALKVELEQIGADRWKRRFLRWLRLRPG